jgi:hypothetical protein
LAVLLASLDGSEVSAVHAYALGEGLLRYAQRLAPITGCLPDAGGELGGRGHGRFLARFSICLIRSRSGSRPRSSSTKEIAIGASLSHIKESIAQIHTSMTEATFSRSSAT